MFLSVIIPTYNRGPLLKKVLNHWETINNFIENDYEIIFSDDGSSDETLKTLKEYNGPLPISVIENNHGGAASARNSAIKLAKGDLILMLGDDIFPDKDLIKHHIELSEKLGPDYAILGEVHWHKDLPVNHLMTHITEVGNQQFSYNRFEPEAENDWRHFYTCNISVHKKWLNSNNLFSLDFHKYGYEDIELGYRLQQKGLKIFYSKLPHAEHYHVYDSAEKFCQRQENAGEMSLVFTKLQPESNDVLINDKRIEIANNIFKRDPEAILKINPDESLKKVFNFIHEIEEKISNKSNSNDIETLDKIYICIFELFYDLGVTKLTFGRDKALKIQIYRFMDSLPL